MPQPSNESLISLVKETVETAGRLINFSDSHASLVGLNGFLTGLTHVVMGNPGVTEVEIVNDAKNPMWVDDDDSEKHGASVALYRSITRQGVYLIKLLENVE